MRPLDWGGQKTGLLQNRPKKKRQAGQPEKGWLNSDKELITYQLLADGFRGAYGQIPSDFQKEVRRDSLYPPSKYNFIEIG